jgi:hypothetical protein
VMNGISAFVGRDTRACFLSPYHMKVQEEVGGMQSTREPSPESDLASTLILGFQPPQQ